MKVKITGYKSGVFSKEDETSKEDKTISYHHMYIDEPLKAYSDVDVAVGYRTIKCKVSDTIADYIEKYIISYGCLPTEPVEVFFDIYGRVDDVDFDV